MRNLYSDQKIDSFDGEDFFLSNFYPSEVPCLGALYTSVEHAYQAAKSLDPIVRESIRGVSTPGKAKRLGGRIVLMPDWEQKKLKFMYELVEYKFHMHDDLKQLLLNTGEAELIEGNYWGDTFWGVCDGKGENHLGKILMRVRDSLRCESKVYFPFSDGSCVYL